MSADKVINAIERKEFIKRLKARQTMKRLPVHAFDEVGDTNGKINKSFGLCEGAYLEDMYHELMANPDNNYVTCMDESLYDHRIPLEEFKGRKISVILKTSKSKSYERRHHSSEAERATKAELICSRVADLYGIRTEYVAPIKDNPYGSIVVDFLSGDEQLEDYGEFTGKHPTVYAEGSSISKWIEPLYDEILHRAPGKNFQKRFAYIRPMLRDLVKQFIFKKYIVHDADFCSANLGIVHTPDYKVMEISPIYDFERCLLPGIRSAQGDGLEEDIEFLVRHWPGLLKSVIKDFTLPQEKKQRMKTIIGTFESQPATAREYYNIIENSTYNFLETARMEYAKRGIDFDTLEEEKVLE